MTQVAPIELAVNHAVNDYRLSLQRQSLLGGGGLDAKRACSAWREYGFPENIEFSMLHSLYKRGGVAHGAVNKIVGTCWRSTPWVIEGDDQDESRDATAWENSLKPLWRGGAFWRYVREADRRRLVGRYSGLLLHFADKKDWGSPVSGRTSLAKMTPVWESCLRPTETDTFGEVKAWTYNGANQASETIHPDRVFILGDSSPDAIGFLEPAYNNFVSMEKVEGGSGESFLKNAARQLNVNFDAEIDLNNIAAMYGVSLDELHTKFNDAARDLNRANDLLFITQGATTTPLVSSVPDPRPTYDINLQTASAALDIPSRVLVGNQQGERASTEDREQFNSRCQSRRNDLSVEISDLLEKLMSLRVIERKDEFSVMWDDLAEPLLADKLANSKTMSEINMASLGQGAEVFTAEEIRSAAGYDTLDDLGSLPEEEDGDE